MAPDLAWIKDIATAAERTVRFVRAVDFGGFTSNEEKQWAVFGQIVIMGEAANRLSQDFQTAHPEIPWHKIIGMRNRIVHAYDEIDWDIVWQVATRDVPQLLEDLRALLPSEET